MLSLPHTAALADQMLAMMYLSQNSVLSSKTIGLVLHLVPDVWSSLLERGLRFVQRRRTCSSVKEQKPICPWTHEIVHTSPQAVELNLSCSGQAHSNRPDTGPGTVLGMTTRILEVFSQFSAFDL